MTIIVFLIDTSASMYQRTYLGGCPTLLDVAKGAVETFVKVRQRSPESRGDRYMLLTFEDPPMNIKAGWKENLATFMNELKNLHCDGLTTMGSALKHTFDVLNLNRMQSGIDTYGQGRSPFFLEPSVIIVITDGGKLTSATGVQEDLTLPMYSPIPGSELTREPFRWDQRLFSLVLRLPGTPALDRDHGLVPSDASPIDVMCEVTGGRSYCITSHRMLMQCIDSLVQKVQSGVVINFEKIGPDPPIIEGRTDTETESELETYNREWDRSFLSQGSNQKSNQTNASQDSAFSSQGSMTSIQSNSWHTCRRLIYVPRSAQKGFAVGFWPIPENFWPDLNSPQLPARTAHPNVKFSCISQEPMVIENLPFDKYELEPSPLTQYILARRQPTVCWQVFVSNSYKSSDVGMNVGHPFGYLKASTNLSCVNLFVMPYNYPSLLPLLEELFKIHRQKPTNEWRLLFQNYLRTMPPYYAIPLRRALTRMGAQGNLAQTLVPDTLDNLHSYSVSNYLKRLKNQAKVEFDRMCAEVCNKNSVAKSQVEGVRVVPRSPLKKELISHPCLQDKFVSYREQLNEYGGFTVGIPTVGYKKIKPSYQNVQDTQRSSLIDNLSKMRSAFYQGNDKILDEDNQHSFAVSQMGNYQEYLKRQPPQLREIESAPLRQHMFGNPFKIDKRMMVDEADIDVAGGSSSNHRGSKRAHSEPSSPRHTSKRKPGPIPKDTKIRRPSSAMSLSSSSKSRRRSRSRSPPPIHYTMNNSKSKRSKIRPPSPNSFAFKVLAIGKSRPPSPLSLLFVVSPTPLASPILSPTPSPTTSPSTSPNVSPEASPPTSPPASPVPWENEEHNGDDMFINNTDDDDYCPNPDWSPMFNGDGASFGVFPPTSPPSPPERTHTVDNKSISTMTCPLDYMTPGINHLGEDDRVLTEINGNYGYLGAPVQMLSVKVDSPEVCDKTEATPQDVLEISNHNSALRKFMLKEIRRPGVTVFYEISKFAKTLKGDVALRTAVLEEIAKECMRFKRHKLAHHLREYVFDDLV